jgi:hypothetical protein
MNTKDSVTKLGLNLAVILVLCNFVMGQTSTFQVVPSEKVPEVLNTISTCVHANFLQIDSWEGAIEVSRYVVYKGEKAKDIFERHTNALGERPSKVAKVTESTTRFSSDIRRELLYAKVSGKIPSRYIDPVDGRDLGTKSIPWYTASILTPEYHLHSNPSRMSDGKFVERKAVKEKIDQDCPSCAQPSTFDPRDLFDARSPVWLQYPRILERIREDGEYVVDGHALKVEQQHILSNVIQYRVHEPGKMGLEGENIWLIKTFSSDAGYNMISLELTRANGEPIHRRTFEYQSVQSIYVPSKVVYESFDPEDGSLQYRKIQIYKNIRLNQSIPAETFTYKNLGLENGDKFIDKMLDKEYTYQDGELTPVAAKK